MLLVVLHPYLDNIGDELAWLSKYKKLSFLIMGFAEHLSDSVISHETIPFDYLHFFFISTLEAKLS